MYDRLTLSYTYNFNKHFNIGRDAIPTWCYSSSYPKDTLANYIS